MRVSSSILYGAAVYWSFRSTPCLGHYLELHLPALLAWRPRWVSVRFSSAPPSRNGDGYPHSVVRPRALSSPVRFLPDQSVSPDSQAFQKYALVDVFSRSIAARGSTRGYLFSASRPVVIDVFRERPMENSRIKYAP